MFCCHRLTVLPPSTMVAVSVRLKVMFSTNPRRRLVEKSPPMARIPVSVDAPILPATAPRPYAIGSPRTESMASRRLTEAW
ncbi:MAG: hypothetical protein Q605_AUC00918G0006 [Actinomyces urogenitalis DORA_12]|uniref:Uncharacterized protein n=1 Tax=Actinomyces urogenitalis DORA_12 TaxID=1403939 RepID=W1VDK4_9ACTO|nr:MAG: hypothetical protein Q605_AUC00918G0006 [Actinomyces urogenitalis DORA_12]